MEAIVVDLIVSSILLALSCSIIFAKPCSNINQTVTGSPRERCDVTTTATDSVLDRKTGNTSNDSGLSSHTVYTIIVVVFGSILIPIIALTRICWLRKLQRQRSEVTNEMRQYVDQRFSEEHISSNVAFSLDLTNIPVGDILGKPPSYEESIANPCIGSPPPYDQS